MSKLSIRGVSESTFKKKLKLNKKLSKVSDIMCGISTVTLLGGVLISVKNKSLGMKLLAASSASMTMYGIVDHWIKLSYDDISDNIKYKR